MKVDGVDPLVMNRIHEQVRHKQVEESRETQTDERVRQRQQALGRPHNLPEDENHQERLQREVERLNDAARLFNIQLRFQIHKESGRMMVQVYDQVEEEIIKEIPPEKVLNLVAQIQNMIGVLLDEKR
jgi:flagellar protein FlaG